MKHHTTDPAQRAEDIALMESERVFKQTSDHGLRFQTEGEIYEQTLREFLFDELEQQH